MDYGLYAVVGESCVARTQAAFAMLSELVDSGNGEAIQDVLHLCNPVDTDSYQDIAALFEIYYDYISTYINTFQ